MINNILKLDGAQKLSRNQQKKVNGGGFNIGGVPIGSTCDFNSLASCLNVCTGSGKTCASCADNNPISGTYECRVSGFGVIG
ncbi:hypothetical protein [Aquimarina sp. 2201CG14-23]|uniref:hypothetical protein n=1 Tax=Aquimarina mycalae TaxID=3040073 RepID=UPI002477FE4F|nr:hypothetical protein [Aquimarina sp. 2201CG14-23]MDH7446963.1 hypothetical protein [Aquimarina sp. 2201CG14-23]